MDTLVVILSNVHNIWNVENHSVSVQNQSTGTTPNVPQVRYALMFVHVYIALYNSPEFNVQVHSNISSRNYISLPHLCCCDLFIF